MRRSTPACIFPRSACSPGPATIFASVSWEQREVGITGPWAPPLYPFKTVIPVTGAMLIMQGVSELIKSLYAAIKGEWPS